MPRHHRKIDKNEPRLVSTNRTNNAQANTLGAKAPTTAATTKSTANGREPLGPSQKDEVEVACDSSVKENGPIPSNQHLKSVRSSNPFAIAVPPSSSHTATSDRTNATRHGNSPKRKKQKVNALSDSPTHKVNSSSDTATRNKPLRASSTAFDLPFAVGDTCFYQADPLVDSFSQGKVTHIGLYALGITMYTVQLEEDGMKVTTTKDRLYEIPVITDVKPPLCRHDDSNDDDQDENEPRQMDNASDAGSSVTVDVSHDSIPTKCSFPSHEIKIEFGLPLPRNQSNNRNSNRDDVSQVIFDLPQALLREQEHDLDDDDDDEEDSDDIGSPPLLCTSYDDLSSIDSNQLDRDDAAEDAAKEVVFCPQQSDDDSSLGSYGQESLQEIGAADGTSGAPDTTGNTTNGNG